MKALPKKEKEKVWLKENQVGLYHHQDQENLAFWRVCRHMVINKLLSVCLFLTNRSSYLAPYLASIKKEDHGPWRTWTSIINSNGQPHILFKN